ncbi:hypothetical protein WAI453_007102 [Rhynchosporium graminicola]
MVHKEIICRHSEILKAAFNGKFVEGETQQYRLEDVSQDVFRLVVEWCYSRNLTLLQLANDHEYFDSSEEHAENLTLVKVWILADVFQMPQLQNEVITSMYTIASITATIPTTHLQLPV